MACTDVTVRVIGDNEFIAKQVQTINEKAKEAADSASEAAVSAHDAGISESNAADSALKAEAEYKKMQGYKPDFITKSNGVVQSNNTKGYDFKGDGVTVIKKEANEFEIQIPKTGDMLHSVYDPSLIRKDVYQRENHLGEQPISSVKGLQDALDKKHDDNNLKKEIVKSLYESNPDTNAFTDSEKSKLARVGKPTDVVNLSENAIPKWDPKAGKLVDSGITSPESGEIRMAPNTLRFGLHSMSSAIEDVTFTNSHTKKNYSPIWQQMKPDNYAAYMREIGARETVVRVPSSTNEIKNPVNDVVVDKDEVFIGGEFTLTRPASDVVLELYDLDGELIWRYEFGDLASGNHAIDFDVPFKVIKNYQYTAKLISRDGDLYARGQGTNFSWTVYRTPFTNKEIAKKEDVDANTARIDAIEKSGTGNGDMLKSVYDKDDDGSVNFADQAYGIYNEENAGNNKFYGTNDEGVAGFFPFPKLEIGNDVNTVKFTDTTYSPQVTDITNKISYFIYEGNNDATFNLIPTASIPEETNSILTISNKASNPVSLTINVASTDTLEDRDGSKTITIPRGDTIALASNRNAQTWYIVGGLYSSKVSGNPVKQISLAPDGSGIVVTYTDNTSSTIQISGISQAEINAINQKIDMLQQRDVMLATEFNNLDKRLTNDETTIKQLHDAFVVYDTEVPTYPAEPNGYYYVTLYALTKTTELKLPKTTPDLRSGTQFFIKNRDTNNSIRLRAETGDTIKGGSAINIPANNFWWGVKDGNDWKELLSGYIAPSYSGMISDIKHQLKADKAFLSDISVQSDAPSAPPLEVSKLAFTGCDVEHDPVDSGLAHIQPRLGVDFINPDGSRVNKVTEVKLVGMEIKDPADGTPPKLILLDQHNVPQPVDTSAYAFFEASGVAPDNVAFSSLPVFRGGRVTVHKDTSAPQYVYVLLPPGEGTETERIGELGGIPAYWSKQSKVYIIGGQSRTYTVFRSPYPFHETDVTLVLYP